MSRELVTREQAERWAHSTLSQTECEIKLAETIVALYAENAALVKELQKADDWRADLDLQARIKVERAEAACAALRTQVVYEQERNEDNIAGNALEIRELRGENAALKQGVGELQAYVEMVYRKPWVDGWLESECRELVRAAEPLVKPIQAALKEPTG